MPACRSPPPGRRGQYYLPPWDFAGTANKDQACHRLPRAVISMPGNAAIRIARRQGRFHATQRRNSVPAPTAAAGPWSDPDGPPRLNRPEGAADVRASAAIRPRDRSAHRPVRRLRWGIAYRVGAAARLDFAWIWRCRSGEALNSTQRSASADRAIEDWVRDRAFREPSRSRGSCHNCSSTAEIRRQQRNPGCESARTPPQGAAGSVAPPGWARPRWLQRTET